METLKRSGADSRAWRLHVFSVERRERRGASGQRRPRRRVAVLAPSAESALAGAAPHRDEDVRAVSPGLSERLEAGMPVALRERADLFRILGTALSTGKSTVQALAMAARQTRSPRLRGTIGAVSVAVSRGEELHEALAGQPVQFPPEIIALAAAASRAGLEQSGRLFVALADRMQRDAKLGRRLAGAMAYPAALMVMTVVAAGILETFALPPMVDLFRSMGAQLPGITELFYQVAGALNRHVVLVTSGVAGLALSAGPLARRLSRSPAWQRFSLRLWGVGPVLLARSLARALGTFLLLRQSGVPNREIFALSGAAAGNAAVQDFFRSTYERVAQGENLEEAFLAERHRLGDEGVRLAGRIEAGFEGGDLSSLLGEVVDDLTDRADSRAAALPKLLELPILTLCGLLVGLLLLAMFLPYPSLLGDVARQMSGGR